MWTNANDLILNYVDLPVLSLLCSVDFNVITLEFRPSRGRFAFLFLHQQNNEPTITMHKSINDCVHITIAETNTEIVLFQNALRNFIGKSRWSFEHKQIFFFRKWNGMSNVEKLNFEVWT